MKSMKAIGSVLSVVSCVALLVLFQNCGNDVQSKRSSNGGALDVEIPPGDNNDNNSNDNTNDNNNNNNSANCAAANRATPFSFNLGCNDSFMYQSGTGQTQSFDAIKYTNRYGGTLETVEVSGMPSAVDLDMSYCQNSALPHCRHINGKGCQGEACVPGNPAVSCNYEKSPGSAELATFFALINGLSITTNNQDQLIADCDTPNFRFFSDELADVDVSLAQQSCVPKGKLYASSGSAAMILSAGTKISDVKAMGDYCNNYAVGNRFALAKFTYKYRSGLVQANQAQPRTVEYIASQKVNIRYRNPGDAAESCISNFHVNPAEMSAFFPQGGLKYKILKTQALLANDGPTAEIEYSEPALGTDTLKFLLDDSSAMTYRGGAVLDSAHSTAIKAAVEALITQAEAANQSAACP